MIEIRSRSRSSAIAGHSPWSKSDSGSGFPGDGQHKKSEVQRQAKPSALRDANGFAFVPGHTSGRTGVMSAIPQKADILRRRLDVS
jgi:hypothetical protein